MIYAAVGLIISAAVCLVLALFWGKARAVLWIACGFALLNSYFAAPLNWMSFVKTGQFWLAPILPRDPPIPLDKLALPTDSPQAIIYKMGCHVCHQIPHIPESYQSNYGPLLIPGSVAQERIISEEYQAQVQTGKAKATTPRDYIMESILDPNAFIVPGYVAPENPDLYLMYPYYAERFTQGGLEKLADYLLTVDADDAVEAGLIVGH